MAMRDWHDDWRVPVLTQEVPKSTEVDTTENLRSQDKVGETHPKVGATKEGECTKEKYTGRQKDTAPQQKEQGAGATET
jgi:hypothetical protein